MLRNSWSRVLAVIFTALLLFAAVASCQSRGTPPADQQEPPGVRIQADQEEPSAAQADEPGASAEERGGSSAEPATGPASGPAGEPAGDSSAGPTAEELLLIDESGRDFAERRVMEVYDRVADAVVTVSTTVLQLSYFLEPIPAEGTGSGFVVDANGHIVTNFHVIEGARSIEVTFADGNTVAARVVGVDPPNDLAVLKVDPDEVDLTPAQLGESNELQVGQRAIAIGNPFGEFGQTLTTGVISAVDRTLQIPDGLEIAGVIQTDAAINRGNSGGPLLDSAGRVIGVNTAIFSPTGTSAGVGFAIPVDTVRRVLPDLIELGRYRHPWLGIGAAYALGPGLARALNLPVEEGLLLVRLQQGSPLARAGVSGATRQIVLGNRRLFIGGDVLTSVAGTAITSPGQLRNLLESNFQVGDQVDVTVVNEDGERQLTVELAEQPM